MKARESGRIVSAAVIVAVGVNSDGRREVLGMDIGPSEAETFWTELSRKLARRVLAQDQRQRGPEGLFPARAGSGVHRQGKGASAIRVRGKGQCRHDRSSLERRPVRDPYRRSAGQSL